MREGPHGEEHWAPPSKWDKEDQTYIEQGIENPYDRYADPLFRAFVKSRYRKETETEKLVTDPKVVQGVVFCTRTQRWRKSRK
jgi:hypothetical protein